MTELQKQEKPAAPVTAIQKQWQTAQYLAQSDLIPKHFAGKPANVLVALEYAEQLSTQTRNLSPISVMQNLYVLNGNVGLSSKFIIALANSSGKFDHSLLFKEEGSGDSLSVTCFSKIHGQEVSYTVSMQTARAEGWTRNPKYKSLPSLMLRYRAAAFLIRTTAPEVIMGLQTDDDVRDVMTAEIVEVSEEEVKKSEALADELMD